MADDVLGVLLDEKDVRIQNLRANANYAIDLILDPTKAVKMDLQHRELTEFEQELLDYETGSEFDGGGDNKD